MNQNFEQLIGPMHMIIFKLTFIVYFKYEAQLTY